MKIYFNRKHLYKKIDYPDRFLKKNLLKTVSTIFGIILGFLILLKPFEVNTSQQKFNYINICCLHALLPAVIIYFYFTTLNYLRAKYPENRNCSLTSEYVHISISLILTGIVSFLIRDLIYFNPNNENGKAFENDCDANNF